MSNLPLISTLSFPDMKKIINAKTEFMFSEALFDYENEYLQYEGGDVVFGLDQINNVGIVNKRERAVTAWIEKILRTELEKYKIYEKDDDGKDEYGTRFHLYIGSVFPIEVIKPLFSNEFERAIMRNEEVENVLDIEVAISGVASRSIHTEGLVIRRNASTVALDLEV